MTRETIFIKEVFTLACQGIPKGRKVGMGRAEGKGKSVFFKDESRWRDKHWPLPLQTEYDINHAIHTSERRSD